MKLSIKSINKALALAMGPLGIIATILGLINDAPGAINLINDQNGNIVLSYKGEDVKENSQRNIIVCLDQTSSANLLTGFYPSVSNNTRFGVNNLAMRYDIYTENIVFEPTDYYSLVEEDQNIFTMKYKDNSLPAFTTIERPFKKIYLKDKQGHLHMKARTSYDGIIHPLQYDIKAEFMVIPYLNNRDFNDWKRKCQEFFLQKVNGLKVCDVYYLSQEHGQEQEINYLLAPSNTKTQKVITESNHSSERKQSEQRTNELAKTAKTEVPVTQYKVTSNKKQSNSILANNQDPIRLRLSRNESSHDLLFTIPDLKKDTLIMVMGLLEDTLTNKLYNELWCMDYKKKYNGMNYGFKCNSNLKVIDYALCTENNLLKDSIKISRNHIISNPLLRTVAYRILGITNSGQQYERYGFVTPNEKSDSQPVSLLEGELTDIRYFQLPENLLTDPYKPIDSYEWIRNSVKIGIIVGLSTICGLFIGSLAFFVWTVFEEWKKIHSFQDIKVLLSPEMEGQSTLSILGQLASIAVLLFVGAFSFIFIILTLAKMYTSL